MPKSSLFNTQVQLFETSAQLFSFKKTESNLEWLGKIALICTVITPIILVIRDLGSFAMQKIKNKYTEISEPKKQQPLKVDLEGTSPKRVADPPQVETPTLDLSPHQPVDRPKEEPAKPLHVDEESSKPKNSLKKATLPKSPNLENFDKIAESQKPNETDSVKSPKEEPKPATPAENSAEKVKIALKKQLEEMQKKNKELESKLKENSENSQREKIRFEAKLLHKQQEAEKLTKDLKNVESDKLKFNQDQVRIQAEIERLQKEKKEAEEDLRKVLEDLSQTNLQAEERLNEAEENASELNEQLDELEATKEALEKELKKAYSLILPKNVPEITSSRTATFRLIEALQNDPQENASTLHQEYALAKGAALSAMSGNRQLADRKALYENAEQAHEQAITAYENLLKTTSLSKDALLNIARGNPPQNPNDQAEVFRFQAAFENLQQAKNALSENSRLYDEHKKIYLEENHPNFLTLERNYLRLTSQKDQGLGDFLTTKSNGFFDKITNLVKSNQIDEVLASNLGHLFSLFIQESIKCLVSPSLRDDPNNRQLLKKSLIEPMAALFHQVVVEAQYEDENSQKTAFEHLALTAVKLIKRLAQETASNDSMLFITTRDFPNNFKLFCETLQKQTSLKTYQQSFKSFLWGLMTAKNLLTASPVAAVVLNLVLNPDIRKCHHYFFDNLPISTSLSILNSLRKLGWAGLSAAGSLPLNFMYNYPLTSLTASASGFTALKIADYLNPQPEMPAILQGNNGAKLSRKVWSRSFTKSVLENRVTRFFEVAMLVRSIDNSYGFVLESAQGISKYTQDLINSLIEMDSNDIAGVRPSTILLASSLGLVSLAALLKMNSLRKRGILTKKSLETISAKAYKNTKESVKAMGAQAYQGTKETISSAYQNTSLYGTSKAVIDYVVSPACNFVKREAFSICSDTSSYFSNKVKNLFPWRQPPAEEPVEHFNPHTGPIGNIRRGLDAIHDPQRALNEIERARQEEILRNQAQQLQHEQLRGISFITGIYSALRAFYQQYQRARAGGADGAGAPPPLA